MDDNCLLVNKWWRRRPPLRWLGTLGCTVDIVLFPSITHFRLCTSPSNPVIMERPLEKRRCTVTLRSDGMPVIVNLNIKHILHTRNGGVVNNFMYSLTVILPVRVPVVVGLGVVPKPLTDRYHLTGRRSQFSVFLASAPEGKKESADAPLLVTAGPCSCKCIQVFALCLEAPPFKVGASRAWKYQMVLDIGMCMTLHQRSYCLRAGELAEIPTGGMACTCCYPMWVLHSLLF